MLKIIVMPDGTVGKARVVRSLDELSGLDARFGLDQSALEAAKQWTFLPGTLDGKPVPVLMTLTLEFKLRQEPLVASFFLFPILSSFLLKGYSRISKVELFRQDLGSGPIGPAPAVRIAGAQFNLCAFVAVCPGFDLTNGLG
jgi:TonB family protein